MPSRPRSTRPLVSMLLMGAALVAAAPGASAVPAPVRISGSYTIVSTDCYFSGGRCSIREEIVQTGTTLTARRDRGLHGRVRGDRMVLGEYVPCCNEDNWYLAGSTRDGGRTIRGTMTDGLSGSGTFTMTRAGGR